MFDQTFVDGTAKTRKPWTVLLSFLGQCALIGVVILIPLIFTDTLPRAAADQLPGGPAATAASATPSAPGAAQDREDDSAPVRCRQTDGAQNDSERYREY